MKKKSFLSWMLSLVLLLQLLPGYSSVSAQQMHAGDLAGHWASESANKWISRQVLEGYGDGTFRPDAHITRAEFAVIMNKVFGYTKKSGRPFADVPDHAWYSDDLLIARQAGYFAGTPQNRALPELPITRQDAVTMMARAFKLSGMDGGATGFRDQHLISDYARGPVSAFTRVGVIRGYPDSTFRPANPITRAETVKLLDEMVKGYFGLAGVYEGETIQGSAIVNTTGVTLKNVVIEGNLYLTEGIGEGDVSLEGVRVKGTTFLSGGGTSSVIIVDSELGTVIVDKPEGDVRIVVRGTSAISSMIAQVKAVLEILDQASIASLTLEEEASGFTITGWENIAHLVNHAEDVTADGNLVAIGEHSPAQETPPSDSAGTGSVGPIGGGGGGGGGQAFRPVNFSQVPEPSFDPMKGNRLPLTGYFEQTITANNLNRTVNIYIPEGARMREYFVVLALESGTDVDRFLLDSGWKDIADANRVCLMVLIPDSGGWKDYASEKPYLDYVLNTAGSGRTWYSVFGVHYLVGYGDGGDILHEWAARNPLFVISQAYLDPNLDPAVLIAAGEEEYGSEIKTFENVPKKDVPIPTWLIGKDLDDEMIAYWKTANDTFAHGNTDDSLRGSTVYLQDKENSNAIATSYSGVVSRVAVLEQSPNWRDKKLSEDIYRFLARYTRYDNTSVYGNVLGDRPDYEALGVESRYLYLQDEFGQTWKREYLAYVPKNSKQLWPDGAPVVYVFSGSTQPNQLFFDSTHWWEVADEYGFIVVVPSSTGTVTSVFNRGAATKTSPDDVAFVEALIDDVNARYDTDPNRAYATGQSAGAMFIHHLAMKIPEKFTAFGGTSGPVMGRNAVVQDASADIAPMYLVFGEYDYWPWVVGPLKPGEFPGTIPNQSDNTYFTQQYWIARNGLGTVDDYVISHENRLPQKENNSVMYLVKPNSPEFDGDRYTIYDWMNRDGVPLFVWAQSAGRAHNNVVADGWLLWEDWFSKWTRDGDTLYYSESGFKNKGDEKAVSTKPVENGIVSLQAITDMRLLGQKLTAVVIEYNGLVDPSKLSDETFEVRDLDSSGENMADAAISRVYTNDRPEMREDGQSVTGHYVIIEISDASNVGNMVTKYVWEDVYGNKQTRDYWFKKDVNTTVKTLKDVIGINGAKLSAAGDQAMPMTKKTVHLKFDEFEDLLVIPSSSGVDNIRVKYRLPKGYDPSKKYPIIMALTGQGTSFWEENGTDNFGTSIAMDPSATAWMEGEDMIIVSTHYRSVVPAYMQGTYNAADDIIATYEYFIENFSVDTGRVYLTGNSLGTVKGFEVLKKRPDLVTAFIVANGAVDPGPSPYPDGRKDELKVELADVAKAGVAIWFHHGRSDKSINYQRAQTAYQALLELHQENGRDEQWIIDNLKFTTYEDEDFVVNGIDIGPPIYHSATKLAYNISFHASWEDRLPGKEKGIGIGDWVRSKTK